MTVIHTGSQLPQQIHFGKGQFTVTDGTDLREWVHPDRIPKAIELLQKHVDRWNSHDAFTPELESLVGPHGEDVELQFSYSRQGQMGDDSFGARGSNPECINVYLVDPEDSTKREPVHLSRLLVRDLGDWMTAGSGEHIADFAERAIRTLKDLWGS